MSHDSRYEKECPQHGWYLDEDGCEKCEGDVTWQKIRAALMWYSAECSRIAATLPEHLEPYEPVLGAPPVQVLRDALEEIYGNPNTSLERARSIAHMALESTDGETMTVRVGVLTPQEPES